MQHAAPAPGDAAGDQQFVVTLVDADFGTTKRVRVRGHYTVGKVKSLACTTFGVSRPDQVRASCWQLFARCSGRELSPTAALWWVTRSSMAAPGAGP